MNAQALTLMALAALVLIFITGLSGPAEQPVTQPDSSRHIAVEKTAQGDLTIEPISHSAIRFEFKGKQYYVDPADQADWAQMPKADAILITHLSPQVTDQIKKDGTQIYANAATVKKAGFGQTIEVGQPTPPVDSEPCVARLRLPPPCWLPNARRVSVWASRRWQDIYLYLYL